MFYVHEKSPVIDLANDMDKMKHIHSVGVVNDKMKVLGILVRRELFDLLGKPYGQDILKHKAVGSLMRPTTSFNYERNIFSVAGELENYLSNRKIEYFLLTRDNNEFAGIFASIDMMIYLSTITQNDINLARSLQANIVKDNTLVTRDTFSITGASKMAKEVGGDFYNIKNYKPGDWLISICDVSGKGVSASLVTTSVSGMFHTFNFNENVTYLIQKINDYIYNSFEMQKFVTGVFIDFRENTGEIVLYDMGHSYIYLLSNDRVSRLRTTNSNRPLGIENSIDPKGSMLRLSKGDILICITDGIIEQVNSKGIEFGERRFASLIRENKHSGIAAIKDRLLEAVYQYRGTQPQHDDMTVIMIEYNGSPEEIKPETA